MADTELYRKGAEIRRRLLGDDWVEKTGKTTYADPVMRKFIDVATETVFGALWSRPGLDLKTRTLVCVVSDAATGLSTIGHTGTPVWRSSTYANACLLTCASALMRRPLTVMSSNVGAAVNPELTYLKVRLKGEVYYVAKGAFKLDRMAGGGDGGSDDDDDERSRDAESSERSV